MTESFKSHPRNTPMTWERPVDLFRWPKVSC